MRLDKFLKNARIIKRRSVAASACSSGHVSVNDKVAKPSTEVRVGDIITMRFGERTSSYQVLDIRDVVTKESAGELYKVVQ